MLAALMKRNHPMNMAFEERPRRLQRGAAIRLPLRDLHCRLQGHGAHLIPTPPLIGILKIEIRFFVRRQRMRQKHLVGHDRFCMCTVGTNQRLRRPDAGSSAYKLVYLERAQAIEIGTTLKPHIDQSQQVCLSRGNRRDAGGHAVSQYSGPRTSPKCSSLRKIKLSL